MLEGGVDYRPWEGQGLDDNHCFLCSRALNDGSRTLEDVIPKWMQRILRAGSQRTRIELPNRTLFSPDKIKIPACRDCNEHHLSRIEKTISTAFRSGPEAVAALPERVLRIWFAKLAYGTRRNDMRIHDDMRNPASGPIASAPQVQQLAPLHLLLQEARGAVHIPGGHSTFFVFTSQTAGCNVCDFDIAIPIGWPYPVMLRLGDVTVLGAVDDRGALQALRDHPAFVAGRRVALHPTQARALWALFAHRCTLLRADRLPVRYGVFGRKLWVDRTPPGGDAFDFSLERAPVDKLLSVLLGETEEAIAAQGGPDGLLMDEASEPRHVPLEHGLLGVRHLQD